MKPRATANGPWSQVSKQAGAGGCAVGYPKLRPVRLVGSPEKRSTVAVGDEVIYGKYGGSDIEVDGDDVKILRETDILAKVLN